MEKTVKQKRYEYFSKNGKRWSGWFDYDGREYKWQLKGKLKNEYRIVTTSFNGECCPPHLKK